MEVTYRGGLDPERLYLSDREFSMSDGRRVRVERSLISDDPENIARLDDMIARHYGRYAQVALFCRPGYRVLDFPCGSGYAADFLSRFGVRYEGRDADDVTIEYARQVYGHGARFALGDLTAPDLPASAYDVIGCIEGLEHIAQPYQSPLIRAMRAALRPGGVLVVSSPENKTGVSGPSRDNPDHLWELTRADFRALLASHFGDSNVEMLTHKAVLDPGGLMTCIYGVCHRSESER